MREMDIWQHAKCYHIKKKNIPEHFVCNRCHVKKQQQQPRRRNSLDSSAEKRKKKGLSKRDDGSNNSKKSDEEGTKKFIPITKSVAKEKVVQDLFIEVHRQWIESNRPLKNSTSTSSTSVKKTGNKGLDSIVVMESNLLLPAIPKASLKPIRKSLRGTSFFQNKNDPSVKKGIFADIHIPENRYLMEVVGQVIRKSEYKTDPKNKFTLLGTPLPRIFFYPSLDICINTRHTGNDTRFIRRSCCPNSEMKSIILPNDSEDQTIHLGVYTKEPVDKGEEITIGWNWHRGHIMWKKSKEFMSKSKTAAELMDDTTKRSLQDTLNLIHDEFGKCACEDEEDCLFEYLKDELEREADEKEEIDSKPVQKKKSPVVKPRKENKDKAVPAATIFTSDEDESSKPKKLGQLNQLMKQAVPPSSPAVSVEESIDIDITSMSPTPDEINVSGLKRARTFTCSTQLPCKKRWLKIYAAQQKQVKTEVVPSINFESTTSPVDIPTATSPLPDLNSKYLENEYDEGELSDGGSSQSTLPLDDSNISPNNTNPPLETSVIQTDIEKKQEVVESPKSQPEELQEVEEVKQETPPLEIQVELASDKVVDKLETPASMKPYNGSLTEETSSPINEEDTLSAPKVKKLSIQEYLKRQRGNLPSPDEKL
ncbi:unnamed protein product [Mucor hiemalis]